LVEFALGAVFLVGLFTGIFQFGYSFYLYNTLESAVRAAAQYAALESYPGCYDQRVRNVAVYGNPNGGTEPVLPGLSPENISVTMNLRDGVPSTVTVGIGNFLLNAVFHSYSLSNKPQVTMPYLGRWAKDGGCS
jgi:TadE-like protein